MRVRKPLSVTTRYILVGAFSVLYGLVALVVCGALLVASTLGDCFDNAACILHRRAAGAWLWVELGALLLIYVVGLVFVARRWGADEQTRSA